MTVRVLLSCLLALKLTVLSFVAAQAAPRYVSIAVDGNTGEVVQATSPDARVHPASLTKIMTLYILFEEMEAGRLNYTSKLKVSKFAAGQTPSKIGLKPGSTIAVRDALLSLVTKSANDVAVVIAENISGSQTKFAQRMTATAQSIGMKRTVFRNASGLPNSEQITTARDMATLGRVIQTRFPVYFKHFNTRSFTYRGRTYRNHNRLIGRVAGVDGIKTGYIRASGFNLVSSMKRDGRHVVAVIIGAKSGKSRNAAMEQLLLRSIKKVKPNSGNLIMARAIPMPARKPAVPAAFAAARAAERGTQVAQATQTPRPATKATATSGGGAPLLLVPNGRGGFKVASASMATPTPLPASGPAPVVQVASAPLAAPQPANAAPVPSADIGQNNPAQTKAIVPRITIIKPARMIPAPQTANVASVPLPKTTLPQATTPQATVPQASVPATGTTPITAPVRFAAAEGGYAIQIGAVPNEKAAHKLIALAQLRASGLLAGRNAFTQTVEKNGSTLWRARFAGFDQSEAKDACAELTSKDFGCFPIRN